MKNRLQTLLALTCLCGSTFAEADLLPVFPGAQGFGVYTPAGRGGEVIHVTNLNARGPASFRAAVETEGARVIVFEVGGVIDLDGSIISVSHPFVTIAGQTAPDPGITLIGGGIRVETHDVLIQHIAVRPGDKQGKGFEPDGISIGGWDGPESYNIVVDHCSFTWAIDENTAVSGRNPFPRDVTYSNCIIAECLAVATHSKGRHSMGTLIHDGVTNVALIGNLYAHNFRRNPYVKSSCGVVMANTIVYNPGQLGLHVSNFSNARDKAPVVSLAGNVFIAGPSTPAGLGLVSALGTPYTIWLKDNLAFNADGTPGLLLTQGGTDPEVRKWNARHQGIDTGGTGNPPLWHESIKPLRAEDTEAHVLRNAGMRPARRCRIDARIVETVHTRTGSIIDSQNEVEGYPRYKPVTRKLSLPVNPNHITESGYTVIEVWLHKQAAEVEGK